MQSQAGTQFQMPPVFDALVITNSGYNESSSGMQRREKPLRQHLDLGDDVAFERLDQDLAKRILDACEPPGFGWPEETRLFAQLVSIIRTNPADPSEWKWDQDKRIHTVLAVSRLIHPVPVGFRYAARVWTSADGTPSRIHPGTDLGRMADAICSRGQRWYLTEDDGKKIKDVLPKYRRASFPERVRGALLRFQHAFYEYYLDFRWLFLSAAMEALVHTDTKKSTRQFSSRLAQLAAQIGMPDRCEKSLAALYHDYRCAVAHGQDIREADPDTIEDYARFEDLVRAILLRCVEDEAFREIFSSDESIRTHLPLRE